MPDYLGMESPFRAELETAIGAVQQAARISQTVLSVKDKGVVEKEDLSPVTVGDFAIQALLAATIHHAFPADTFVGEESAQELRDNPLLLNRVWGLLEEIGRDEGARSLCSIPESKERMCEVIDWCGSGVPGPGRVWVFDPIDGTKTFVRGEMYAINIALLEAGKQVLSVVACPLLSMDAQVPVCNDSLDPAGQGCILFAAKGYGTYVRPLPGAFAEVQPRKIEAHAAAPTSLTELRSVTCFNMLDSGVDDVHKVVTEKLGVAFPGCDLLGWVPRWAVLALGLANMTVWVYKKRTRQAKLWDHAGAMLLFEEVGGKITDVDGKDIDVSAGRKLSSNFGFVAAPRHLHAAVLKAVHDSLRELGKQDLLALK